MLDGVALKRNWLKDTLRRFNFLATLRERGKIRRLCVEALTLYRQVEIDMPQASNTARYARVIERRSGADAGTARQIMRRAEESFALWPVERPLNFRDIVQYMAVTDGLHNDIAVAGVGSRFVDDTLDIVHHMIPADL